MAGTFSEYLTYRASTDDFIDRSGMVVNVDCFRKRTIYTNFVRTPRLMFWKRPWRRRVLSWRVDTGEEYRHWQYASHADFLTM